MQISIGEKLKNLRKKKGLSQMDLALKSKLSCNFIGMMERDMQNPSIDSFIRIAHGLGMGVLELTLEFINDNLPDFKMSLNEGHPTYIINHNYRDSIIAEMSSCLFSMNIDEVESLFLIVKTMCKKV